jgi:kinesin family protein 6/9
MFKETNRRSNRKYEIGISYLEIYNENGYDLLDDTRDAKQLEDLPYVQSWFAGKPKIHFPLTNGFET